MRCCAGKVTGLANPASYQAALLLEEPANTWWSKPYPVKGYVLGADGSFSALDWASNPSVSAY